MSSADDVLAELKSIGALGKPKAPPAPRVEKVNVEEAAPEVPLIDQRGEAMVGLLTEALDHLDTTVESLSGLRDTIRAIRQVWTAPEDAEAPESPQEALVRPGAVGLGSTPEDASEPPPEPAAQEFSEEERTAALEAARRKIRGEDLTVDQQAKAWAEEEASIPTVGADRALAETTGETSVRSMGTIKPSFPVEEGVEDA